MFAAAMILALTNAPAAAAAPVVVTTGPVKMKPSEIRAYNSAYPRTHPNYIRCQRVEETGSLVRKSSVCRTNEEWDRIEAIGNREAREATENLQRGWTNGKG